MYYVYICVFLNINLHIHHKSHVCWFVIIKKSVWRKICWVFGSHNHLELHKSNLVTQKNDDQYTQISMIMDRCCFLGLEYWPNHTHTHWFGDCLKSVRLTGQAGGCGHRMGVGYHWCSAATPYGYGNRFPLINTGQTLLFSIGSIKIFAFWHIDYFLRGMTCRLENLRIDSFFHLWVSLVEFRVASLQSIAI